MEDANVYVRRATLNALKDVLCANYSEQLKQFPFKTLKPKERELLESAFRDGVNMGTLHALEMVEIEVLDE